MEDLFKPAFATSHLHIASALKHYRAMVGEFQQGEWEQAIAKSGKFTEALLKALWLHVGKPLPPPREFKAGAVIDQLANVSKDHFSDSVRLTIPRACRFVYDIASNRGARHDAPEVDPNVMDARAAVALASWVLAELVRAAQKGKVDVEEAREIVDRLTERKYPVIEEVDGRPYFHLQKPSARDIAVLTLWHAHPRRVDREFLLEVVKRHGFTLANARMGLTRLGHWVDDGGPTGLRLLVPGIAVADGLIAASLAGGAGVPKPRRARTTRRRGRPLSLPTAS